jgi:hypothetical protein
VNTVAMEATGVYWINLYGVLEEAGMKVMVVNGAHCRNIPVTRITPLWQRAYKNATLFHGHIIEVHEGDEWV